MAGDTTKDVPRRRVWISGIADSVITALASAVANASGMTTFMQEEAGFTGSVITVTKNGGILPLSDDDITIVSTIGLHPQSQWTVDRVAEPNTITFSTAVVDAIDIQLLFSAST